MEQRAGNNLATEDKVETPPVKSKKRAGISLTETQMGYLFVLPALLIILVIAIWPVVRSFWFSLYDIRLNDPAKSQIQRQSGIDMERYVSTIPSLLKTVDKERKNATGTAADHLQQIKQQVELVKENLNKEKQVSEYYKQVDELLYDFKPVPDNLKYAQVDTTTAEQVKKQLGKIKSQLEQLANQKSLKRPNESLGLVNALQISFISPNYIGLKYYSFFLQDKRMWTSLANTIIFTVVSVSVELVLGLAIALLINKEFKGRGLVRAAVLVPWAIPTAISAMMWKFMYDGQNGIVAKLLESTSIIQDMGTLLSTKFGAMCSVIFADVWKTTPFMALLILAGLQTIPDSLYEAAEVDGASKIQRFIKITLPMIKTTILVALLFRTLDAFRIFDLVYVLTGGGPANSTETISIYAYKTMFAQMNFGAGSALSVIVFICVAMISIGYVKILGSDLINDGNSK